MFQFRSEGVAMIAIQIGLLAAAFGTTSGRAAKAVDPPSSSSATKPEGAAASAERAPYDPEQISKVVAFWEKRVKRDPRGFLELRELAGAYLNRQRETGDVADAVRAEDAARRSLKIFPRNNAPALNKLARGLLGQHRFPEALATARQAVELDPDSNRLVADIELELGGYEQAEHALAASSPEPDDLNALALRARFEQINGKPEKALELMLKARQLTDNLPDMPAEAVAWYHTMVGHMLIDAGRLDEGERACRQALEIFPRDYRAMTGMAEAATWRGDAKGAVEWGQKAIQIAPQNPEALKLIGEALAAQGQTKLAESQYQLLKELAHSFPRIYDRHWALFCADHDRDLDEALSLARKDLELRQDVHGYDTLAWVCFKKGLLPEAESAIQKALARGTQDASIFYHAGMIARAGGDKPRADSFFARARSANPYLLKSVERTEAELKNPRG